jgi:hypothetical protein
MFGWQIGMAMHGVFRRAPIVESGMWLPRTKGDAHADTAWLFGVALLGRFEFVPQAHCLKRFYPASTYAQWDLPERGELPRIMTGYLSRQVPSKRQRLPALALLWLGAALNRAALVANLIMRRELFTESAMRGMFRRLLR